VSSSLLSCLYVMLHHNRRKSNAFGDARFLFCPNLIKFAQILSLLHKCRPNFAQIWPKCNQFYPKRLRWGMRLHHLLLQHCVTYNQNLTILLVVFRRSVQRVIEAFLRNTATCADVEATVSCLQCCKRCSHWTGI